MSSTLNALPPSEGDFVRLAAGSQKLGASHHYTKLQPAPEHRAKSEQQQCRLYGCLGKGFYGRVQWQRLFKKPSPIVEAVPPAPKTQLNGANMEAVTALLLPNPTTGSVQCSGTGTLLMYNTLGHLVHSSDIVAGGYLDLSHLPAGTYWYRTAGSSTARILIRY
ncbi:MAG: T9SS type A sorting domain-containing protein [Sphingobacteriales bacterium]|nr:T9SS type A sorting domain-containing protein [Sphingobacteriales bacterium]